jgi:hypothetical protein
MKPEAWGRHVRKCPDCQAEAARDRRLSEETPRLRTPIQAPGLWGRIESSLRTEAGSAAAGQRDASARPPIRSKRFRLWPLLVPAAAGAALILAVTVLPPRKSASSSGLLDRQTLARVDAQEKEYIKAIGDLEKLAKPKISVMDPSLVSLYRDRLAVIDAQIEKCREALDKNPGNAHIRRYFLAALQDKKQTLAEALGS